MIPTPTVRTLEVVNYYRRHYKEYLLTQWWHDINEQYIRSNKDAKCWICHKTRKQVAHLLLHHLGDEAYAKLFQEKLGRDVLILCLDCHTRTHFHKRTGEKIPLTRKDLLHRMRILRYTYIIRTFRLGSFINTIGSQLSKL